MPQVSLYNQKGFILLANSSAKTTFDVLTICSRLNMSTNFYQTIKSIAIGERLIAIATGEGEIQLF
jgi:hypothetical protein